MGLLDRILGQPAHDRGLAAEHARLDTRPIGFAAQRIEPGVKPDRRVLERNAKRSAEMWNTYESVGEVGYLVDFFGNAMRRVRVFPAGVDDPEQGRIPLEECGWATEGLARDARAALDRVRSAEHGQGEVLAEMAKNLKVAGAGNIYAAVDEDLGEEDWKIISTDALVFHRGSWAIKATPDDRKPTPVDLATDPIWRFWQRHPRWPGLAYSEMSRVLGHAENLQLLERAARARGRSRLAGSGVLAISSRYNLQARRSPNGPVGADFFDDLMTAGTAAIKDEAAVSSFMPIMADFDVDDIRKVMQHITFDRPLTEIEEAREDKLLRRIGQGLDGPPELVTGFHDVKFANGLIIQQETYEAHVEPLALRIADIFAVTVLRSALLAAGHPAELVSRVMVGVDPKDLIRRPDRKADAKDAHKALVISDEALRDALEFTDDDAPAMDELLRRMAIARGVTTEALTTELLEKYAGADVVRTIEKVEAQTDAIEANADATASEPSGENAVAAAATVPTGLGERLTQIDQDLTARLMGAAESAVETALQRATARAANRVRGHELRQWAPIVRQGGRGLTARLGPDGMSALAVTDEQLITDSDFDTLAGQWDTWVGDAHQAAAAEVTATTGEPVTVDDDDHDAGWLILLLGLVTATRSALAAADSDVASTTDGTTGETDPSATVQPGLIRQALARAGGAQGQPTDGGAILLDAGTRPAGLVATGEQILRAAVDAGLILTGWTWMVGAPARPFPPHQALANVTFSQWDATSLANSTGEWPGVAYFHPGDHLGCRCTAQPNLEEPSSN